MAGDVCRCDGVTMPHLPLQAPVSMKSILQAAWHLTVAGGNFIVIIITEARFFESQVKGVGLHGSS